MEKVEVRGSQINDSLIIHSTYAYYYYITITMGVKQELPVHDLSSV